MKNSRFIKSIISLSVVFTLVTGCFITAFGDDIGIVVENLITAGDTQPETPEAAGTDEAVTVNLENEPIPLSESIPDSSLSQTDKADNTSSDASVIPVDNELIGSQPTDTAVETVSETVNEVTIEPEDAGIGQDDTEASDSLSDNSTGETVSENSVSENSVSENSVSENSIDEDITLEASVSGVEITLKAPYGTFPEDAELSVIEINESTDSERKESIDDAINAKEENEEVFIREYRAFDICVLADADEDGIKEEVQPADQNQVSIEFSGDIFENYTSDSEVTAEAIDVYYLPDDSAELESVASEALTDKNVAMTTDHFSTYVVSTQVKLNSSQFNLSAYKSAKVSDWDARTYEITLGAFHDNFLQKETDINLVLDVSASMTWVMTQDAADKANTNYMDWFIYGMQNEWGFRNEDNFRTDVTGNPQGWNYRYYALNFYDEWGPVYYNRTLGRWQCFAAKYDGEKDEGSEGYYSKENGIWRLHDKNGNLVDKNTRPLRILDRYPNGQGTDPIVKTKIEVLQDSVRIFLKNYRTACRDERISNNDSSVSIVTFSNEKHLHTALNTTEVRNLTDEQIESAIGAIEEWVTGNTDQVAGLEEGYGLIRNVNNRNDKYMILFTDGRPTDRDADAVIKEAKWIRGQNINVITVGISSADTKENETIRSIINGCAGDKNNTRSDWAFFAESAAALSNAFESVWAIFSPILSVDVVDVIDSRFYLTDAQREIVASIGGTVSGDGRTITFSKEEVVSGSEDEHLWSKTFTITANEDYAGGNDITTNGEGSGIRTDSGTWLAFPRPTVNVKSGITLTDARDVFFLGEKISDVYTDTNKLLALFDGIVCENGRVTQITYFDETIDKLYKFTDLRDVTVSAPDISAISDITPTTIRNVYENAIKVIVSPNESGAASIGNMLKEGGDYYRVETITGTADFTAYLVDGSLEIKKTIDRTYESEKVADKIVDNQTFIFKIEKYKDENGNVKDPDFKPVYETISFKYGDPKTKSKKVIGLSKGYYKVTEETGWSKKFKNIVSDNRSVYVGRTSDYNADGQQYFSGLDSDRNVSSYKGARRYAQLKKTLSGADESSSEEWEFIRYRAVKNTSKKYDLTFNYKNEKRIENGWFGDVSSLIDVIGGR